MGLSKLVMPMRPEEPPPNGVVPMEISKLVAPTVSAELLPDGAVSAETRKVVSLMAASSGS